MTIKTNLGAIEVELDRAKTPCTAAFLSHFVSDFTVLGRVRTGMDMINSIAWEGTQDGSGDGKPRSRLSIEAVTVR